MFRYFSLLSLVLVLGCTEHSFVLDYDAGDTGVAARDSGTPDGGSSPIDAGTNDAGGPTPRDAGPLTEDAACAAESVEADIVRRPVDIIWLIDNSVSMQPSIEAVQSGINRFAELIGARDLDYRVIFLSLRGVGETRVDGSRRFQVCVPPPLAGDAMCGDGSRFFHINVDIRSTQPLEQLLGTLGQTPGYTADQSRGSGPWRDLLRPEATKTIVVVTDDNARMVVRAGTGFEAGPSYGRTGDPMATADWFETRIAGLSPFSSWRQLPAGIQDASWDGLFENYLLSAIYGWGSETDASIKCASAQPAFPASSGPTYTNLVARTGGVRAQICDSASAWTDFFDSVATAVETRSRLACEITIPVPPEGELFQSDRVNVEIRRGDSAIQLPKVPSASACGSAGGWYYDDESAPTQVILCPMSCDEAQPTDTIPESGINVLFGCQTVLI